MGNPPLWRPTRFLRSMLEKSYDPQKAMDFTFSHRQPAVLKACSCSLKARPAGSDTWLGCRSASCTGDAPGSRLVLSLNSLDHFSKTPTGPPDPRRPKTPLSNKKRTDENDESGQCPSDKTTICQKRHPDLTSYRSLSGPLGPKSKEESDKVWEMSRKKSRTDICETFSGPFRDFFQTPATRRVVPKTCT